MLEALWTGGVYQCMPVIGESVTAQTGLLGTLGHHFSSIELSELIGQLSASAQDHQDILSPQKPFWTTACGADWPVVVEGPSSSIASRTWQSRVHLSSSRQCIGLSFCSPRRASLPYTPALSLTFTIASSTPMSDLATLFPEARFYSIRHPHSSRPRR